MVVARLSRFTNICATAGLIVAFSPALANESRTQLVYSFSNQMDGSNPCGGLASDGLGNLYGTAVAGGYYAGTVFQLRFDGQGGIAFTPIYLMTGGAEGVNPVSTPAIGKDGDLYITSSIDGVNAGGSIFQLVKAKDNSWALGKVYRLDYDPDGGILLAGITLDGSDNVYGVAYSGGANNLGYVFELTPHGRGWSKTKLLDFNGANGANPYGSLAFGADGRLYGTTMAGGNHGSGVVFELHRKGNGWAATVLHNFAKIAEGSPAGSLTFDQYGNLYGTASGGSTGHGAVFELLRSVSGGPWSFQNLYGFTGGSDGGTPYGGLTFDTKGALYGTTTAGGLQECYRGCGVMFKLTPPAGAGGAWSEKSLQRFTGADDSGVFPYATPIFGPGGKLYGTAQDGGALGFGTVFSFQP